MIFLGTNETDDKYKKINVPGFAEKKVYIFNADVYDVYYRNKNRFVR